VAPKLRVASQYTVPNLSVVERRTGKFQHYGRRFSVEAKNHLQKLPEDI
jgi:hypothetical protein